MMGHPVSYAVFLRDVLKKGRGYRKKSLSSSDFPVRTRRGCAIRASASTSTPPPPKQEAVRDVPYSFSMFFASEKSSTETAMLCLMGFHSAFLNRATMAIGM